MNEVLSEGSISILKRNPTASIADWLSPLIGRGEANVKSIPYCPILSPVDMRFNTGGPIGLRGKLPLAGNDNRGHNNY